MIGKDVSFALRSLLRAPGYTAAFVLTLGMAIGLNTAIFSVINGVLLAPLPYQDADRILYVRQPAEQAGVPNVSFSFEEVEDYRRQSRTLDGFVEYGDWNFNIVPDDGDPHRVVGGLVNAEYFEVLGLRPLHGRILGPQDDGDGAEPAAVLTHDYWTRAFGADPGVIGRTVKLYAFQQPKTTRIVGVLEPGTHYTGNRRQDLFVNYATNDHYMGATMQDDRTHRMTDMFVRMRPGQTVESARAELASLNDAMHASFPEAYPSHRGYGIRATLWQDELTAGARSTFLVLMGTVGLILLLAAANVANLTLTRLVARDRELGVRAALGATRSRLRRQLLAENLVLATGGALLGLLLAAFGLDLLVEYANRFTVRTGEIGIATPVLLFTVALALVIAVLLAWAPSLPGGGGLGSAVMAAGSDRGSVGGPRKRVQRALVVGQLALSFTLLIGAGLLVRSLINLTRVDAGFDVENVVTMQAPNITGMGVAENVVLMDQVVDDIRGFPGVSGVAYADQAPFDGNAFLSSVEFRVEGGDPEGTASPMVATNRVSPAYFDVVGLEIVQGRSFQRSDDPSSDTVAIINERMALDHFGSVGDALGRRMARKSFNGQWGVPARIVGVAADSREYGLATAGVHTVYLPAHQAGAGQSLLVRTNGQAGPLARRVAEVVRGLDPDRPVDNVATLETLLSNDIAPERLNATLFSAFALLALLIAAVGVLGVLAFTVSQRTREFGVRMALGARESQVLGMVLREGALMTLASLAVGAVAALFLSRFLVDLLFEVEALDPATYGAVGLILGAVALLAAYLPARRATRVDPMEALRSE